MDMKKMLEKFSEVQNKPIKETNTTPKAGKKVLKESVDVAPASRLSLKDVFHQIKKQRLSEDAPIPVPVQQQGSNKPASAGVVTINDPELQKTLGPAIKQLSQDKKITVVTPQQQQQQSTTQPANASTTQPVSEESMDEDKWIQKAIKHPGAFSAKAKKAGMSTAAFAAKHKHDSGKLGKQARLAQTLSKLHKEGIEEADIPHTGGMDVDGAGLGAGRSQTTLEDYKLPSGVKVVQPETHKMPKAPKGSAPRNPLDDLEKKSLGQKVKSLFTKKGIEEAETLQQAGVDGTSRGGLGMGRSTTTLESRTKADNKAEKAGKKVTKDLEYDMKHKGKDDKKAEKAGKKVTKDIEYDEKKKAKKKKLKESHENKMKAAHHFGRAHALAKHGYNCPFEEGSQEHRMYHEGYKQGLDECYGTMSPIHGLNHGVMDETSSTVDDMASFGAHTPELEETMPVDEMDKTSWMKHKAQTTPGDTFKAFGQTFKDKDVLETDMSVFESWDAQLNNLLTEYTEINEGLSVAMSDQEGQPKSVTVTATDQAADELMSIVKQAGLGMFSHDGPSADGEKEVEVVKAMNAPKIDVVDDHDGMMSLIKKMTGHSTDHGDYEDEKHDHEHEEGCNECGMMECACSGRMDEVETEDQMTYQVAEDGMEEDQSQNPPDSGKDNAMNATLGNAAQNMVASKSGGATNEEELEEAKEEDLEEAKDEEETDESEKLDEWANQAGSDRTGKGTDAQFTQDMDFMTKVISGGLNKPKRDQTTLPHTSVKPSVADDSMMSVLRKLHAIEK